MEEYNKSYGANNHTSLLSHAQSQSPIEKVADSPPPGLKKLSG